MEKAPTVARWLEWGEEGLARVPQGDDPCAVPQRMSRNRRL